MVTYLKTAFILVAMSRYLSFLVSVCLCSALSVAAQTVTVPEATRFDTANISDHVRDLVVRVYGSNKFTRLGIGKYGEDRWVQYKPNSNYNTGFGFNYRYLGINIGFKTPGINEDNDKYGRTKYLDLQSYVYMRKLCLDVYAQTYQGYYLADNRFLQPTSTGTPAGIRPDIRTRDLGIDAEYLFNGRRFSYRAIYLQNERQLKSAGTPIVGAGIHWVHAAGDSALVPAGPEYAAIVAGYEFDQTNTVSLSLKGGYAYTLVLGRRFFLMGSLVAGAGVNYLQLRVLNREYERNFINPQFTGIARLGAGFSSERYFAGVYFTTNLLHDHLLGSSGNWLQYETGLVRLALARRLVLSEKTAGRINRILPGRNW